MSTPMLPVIHDKAQSAFYRLAYIVGCHQRADRSYFIRGRQIPLCARCLGIVGGCLLAPMCDLRVTVSILLLVLMVVDGLIQSRGFRESTNLSRLLTGGGFGIGSGVLLLLVLRFGVQLFR
jgi:uncharacterized membrane protein